MSRPFLFTGVTTMDKMDKSRGVRDRKSNRTSTVVLIPSNYFLKTKKDLEEGPSREGVPPLGSRSTNKSGVLSCTYLPASYRDTFPRGVGLDLNGEWFVRLRKQGRGGFMRNSGRRPTKSLRFKLGTIDIPVIDVRTENPAD